MINLDKAIEFVKSHGNEVEQARLQYLLVNERPSQEIVARLFAGQRPDGGWLPFWADNYSSLDTTCFRLAQAEQLGMTESETAIRRAVQFLTKRQLPDGSWEEHETVVNLAPPWARPGDLSAQLYLTANCGLWLAILGNPEDRAVKAARFLRACLDQEGHLPSFLHTHWLAASLWYKINWQETSERVFEYLCKRISDLAASNLSWLILTLHLAGVTKEHHLIDKAISMLKQYQQEDGCWKSEDGPSQDVHTTLEAIRVLWLYRRA